MKLVRRKTVPETNTLLPVSSIHHSIFETGDIWKAFYHLAIKINSIITLKNIPVHRFVVIIRTVQWSVRICEILQTNTTNALTLLRHTFQLLKGIVILVQGYETNKLCVNIWNLVTVASNMAVKVAEFSPNRITGKIVSYNIYN